MGTVSPEIPTSVFVISLHSVTESTDRMLPSSKTHALEVRRPNPMGCVQNFNLAKCWSRIDGHMSREAIHLACILPFTTCNVKFRGGWTTQEPEVHFDSSGAMAGI